VLTILMTPIAVVLLCVTIIGLPLVPFVAFALFIAMLFGKTVMLAWIGRPFTRLIGNGSSVHPVIAVVIGGLLMLVLYTIPVFGIILYKLLSWLGLGVVVYTLILSSRREKAPVLAAAGIPASSAVPMERTSPPSETPIASAFTAPPSVASPPSEIPSDPTSPSSSGGAGVPPPSAVPPIYVPPPVVPPVPPSTLPRAGFMIRFAALLLDLILMGILVGVLADMTPRSLHFHEPPGFLLIVAAYGAVMWKLRGTTVGGIVCGLKVVRLDGREIDWVTAIVRALSCFLSLVVVGLGFLWVAFDDERQSWHDKVAGTTVVRVPKGTALI
jgi:uncharacterized RDD family membrane protein YckC